jgi:septal ring factor EnvC (AmiA/AmiB activator)
MYRQPAKGLIRPKISTMPRQKSEASALLDTYKLVIEKKRLEQEQQTIEARRHQIDDRLAMLKQQIDALEQSVGEMRDQKILHPVMSPVRRMTAPAASGGFEMEFLDY